MPEKGISNSLTRSLTHKQSVRRFVYSICFVHVRCSMYIAGQCERVAELVGLNSASIAPLHCNVKSNARMILCKSRHVFLCPPSPHTHHLGGTSASARESERERERERE
jgi:hypothetical protein